jgi:hypothetical protein
MPLLFPQLLAEVGKRLAAELSTLTVEEAGRRAEERSEDPSSNSVFSATGGTRVTSQQLTGLRKEVLARASEYGFPMPAKRDNLKCDAEVAVILRDRMNLTPHEAACDGVWEYLTCVLMPDFVVWRFRDVNGRTSVDRFLAAGRRNAFHRLWWRAYVLAGDLGAEAAKKLLGFLTEDDMVQTMERPGLFGNLRMMRLYYAEFRKAVEDGQLGAPREAVNRDAHKRLLRIVAVRVLNALADDALKAELRGLIGQSAAQVRQTTSRTRTAT